MKNKIETEQFGMHFMMDGYGASAEMLRNKEKLLKLLFDIPTSMGMHVISNPLVVEVGPKNRKDPGGLSGFVIIAESHLSFHTFPNRGFVTVDVYTCQNNLNTDKLLSELTVAFGINNSDVFIQKRGVRYPVQNIY